MYQVFSTLTCRTKFLVFQKIFRNLDFLTRILPNKGKYGTENSNFDLFKPTDKFIKSKLFWIFN